MALALRVTPDTAQRAAGAAAVAIATDLADLKATRLLQQVENGQLLELATLTAKAFNVLPDNSWGGQVLNGATDASVGFLVRDFSTSRLNPALTAMTPSVVPAVTPAVTPAAPAGSAAAASSQVATSGNAGSAATESAQAAY